MPYHRNPLFQMNYDDRACVICLECYGQILSKSYHFNHCKCTENLFHEACWDLFISRTNGQPRCPICSNVLSPNSFLSQPSLDFRLVPVSPQPSFDCDNRPDWFLSASLTRTDYMWIVVIYLYTVVSLGILVPIIVGLNRNGYFGFAFVTMSIETVFLFNDVVFGCLFLVGLVDIRKVIDRSQRMARAFSLYCAVKLGWFILIGLCVNDTTVQQDSFLWYPTTVLIGESILLASLIGVRFLWNIVRQCVN
jgi:hypothetical protein